MALTAMSVHLALALAFVSIAYAQEESGLALGGRMSRLEQLVIRQDLVIRQFERERQHLEKEKEQCSGLRAEWEETRQQWHLEKQGLKDDMAILTHKLERASDGDFTNHAKTTIHGVVPRSDDNGPLESVVTQIAQRLTEVSAEVQTLKTAHTSDIQALRDANVHQDQAIQGAGSSVYVRWGNSACPTSTSLVYSGIIAGSQANEPGGAANPLCMSMSPVPGPSLSLPSNGYSAVYGAEYQTYDSHADKDPVCAVCRSPRATVVMTPGTNRCELGWTTEYSGFLMAGSYSQTAPTEYICVDSKFESRVGSSMANSAYKLFYSLVHCGTLPCEPYISRAVITCAVCSK